MEKIELDRKAKVFYRGCHGCNNYIKNNLDEDPNMFEITEYYLFLGEIMSEYKSYYDEVGYPVIDGKKMTNKDIKEFDDTAKACVLEMRNMLSMRNLYNKEEDKIIRHPLFRYDALFNLFNSIKETCEDGEYYTPESLQTAEIKKELLRKCMGVSLYIWQVQVGKNEEDYQYDNRTEFNGILQMNTIYKEDKELPLVKFTNSSNVGHQFEEFIDGSIVSINDNYKFNSNNRFNKNSNKTFKKIK